MVLAIAYITSVPYLSACLWITDITEIHANGRRKTEPKITYCLFGR